MLRHSVTAMPFVRPLLSSLLSAALLASGLSAHAADLLEIYRQAQTSDAQYAAAKAAREAGEQKLAQGRSGLLPSVVLTGNTTRSQTDLRQPSSLSLPGTNTYSYGVQLSQPLFRWQNWVNYQQGGLQTALSEVQFGDAKQNLILRSAQAYFDVLVAEETLTTLQKLKTASAEQLELAKKSFEVGTVTITDVHEAQSRFDLASAQEIQASSDLEVKRYALRVLTGQDAPTLQALRPQVALERPQPEAMTHWVNNAEEHNLGVQMQQLAFEIASREVEKSYAGHLPTLDIVAGRMDSKNLFMNPAAPQNSFSYETVTNSVGLQFNMPLFQGGYQVAHNRETVANREKSRADVDSARRNAGLAARQAYLGVVNGLAQIKALEAAERSSTSSLDANKLGYDVGVRINIDVLNAQSQLADTQQKLVKARYDTLLAQLKLKAAAGQLSEDDLVQINTLLQH